MSDPSDQRPPLKLDEESRRLAFFTSFGFFAIGVVFLLVSLAERDDQLGQLQGWTLVPQIVLMTALVLITFFTAARALLSLVVRRGFDLVEGGSSAADFCDDLFGGLVPDEGLGVVVPVFGPDLDGIDEVGHAGEHASA